jgi:hypothetical protein
MSLVALQQTLKIFKKRQFLGNAIFFGLPNAQNGQMASLALY